MSYDKRDVEVIRSLYDPLNVRTWPFCAIIMPLKEGNGPATDSECDEITFEVWDYFCNSYGSYKCLPDAINQAMKLTKELMDEV
jgi:hypothetical protein